jgi:hypothetical protein
LKLFTGIWRKQVILKAYKASLKIAGAAVKVMLTPENEQKVRCVNTDHDPYYSDSPLRLKLNDVYTIDHTEAGSFLTYFYLKEIEGAYNSVRFEHVKT